MKRESVGDGNKAKRTIIKYIKMHTLEQVPTVYDSAVPLCHVTRRTYSLGRSSKLRASTKVLRVLGPQIGCLKLFVVYLGPSRQILFWASTAY